MTNGSSSLEQKRRGGFCRCDGVLAVLFCLVAVAVYVPFRSQVAYHWDSAEFTLAVRDYNVALSQPHAPGYFLFIMLGRLVDRFVGDPHASLVWISVACGGGLAAVMYLLGTGMFGRRTGIAAGLFAMTSPQVWFHSCVALTYVVDGFLVSLLVLLCWRAVSHGGSWGDAVAIGVLVAVVGGVRQQSVPVLVPLLLLTFWKFRKARAAKLGVAAATALLLGLAWFVPMVRLSGGLPVYLEIVRRHAAFNASVTALGGGLDAFLWNVAVVGMFCGNGLMLGVVLLAGALVYRVAGLEADRKRAWDRENAVALLLLAVWIASGTLFGVIGFTSQPGYVLTYLPGLLLLAAVTAAQIKKPGAFIAITAAVCLVNAGAFLAWPQRWDRLLGWTARSAREIRQHDVEVKQLVQLIRKTYVPSQAFLCNNGESFYLGMREFQIYLPEFEQYEMAVDPTMLTPPGKPRMRVRQGRLEFTSGIGSNAPPIAVLVVPPGGNVSMFRHYLDIGQAREIMGSSGMLYTVPLDGISHGN